MGSNLKTDIKPFSDYIKKPIDRDIYLNRYSLNQEVNGVVLRKLEIVYAAVRGIRARIADFLAKDRTTKFFYILKSDVNEDVKHLTETLTEEDYSCIYYTAIKVYIKEIIRDRKIVKCSKYRSEDTPWLAKINRDERMS